MHQYSKRLQSGTRNDQPTPMTPPASTNTLPAPNNDDADVPTAKRMLAKALLEKAARAKANQASQSKRRIIAKSTQVKINNRRVRAAIAAEYGHLDTRSYDTLARLVKLDNPDVFELLETSLSCMKALKGQRDYQLDRQQRIKEQAKRNIQQLRAQADTYRQEYLRLQQANDKLRATRKWIPSDDQRQ